MRQARASCECEHDFTLILSGVSDLTTPIEDAFFEAGCSDATLSMRSGRAFLTFSRTASSLKEAILRAVRDVRAAGVGADVLRVDVCNLVTQADIARKIGRSRQLVHQYVTAARGPGGFPPPACDLADDVPLYNWCEVAYWLWEHDMIQEDVLREAQEVAAINSVLELNYQKRLDPGLVSEVLETLGTA